MARLGADGQRPIEVVGVEGGGCETLPNIGAIALCGNDAAEGSGGDSAASRFRE